MIKPKKCYPRSLSGVVVYIAAALIDSGRKWVSYGWLCWFTPPRLSHGFWTQATNPPTSNQLSINIFAGQPIITSSGGVVLVALTRDDDDAVINTTQEKPLSFLWFTGWWWLMLLGEALMKSRAQFNRFLARKRKSWRSLISLPSAELFDLCLTCERCNCSGWWYVPGGWRSWTLWSIDAINIFFWRFLMQCFGVRVGLNIRRPSRDS